MSIPNIQFKFTHLTPDVALEALTEQKFSGLTKFLSDAGDDRITVEFEREAPHQHGQVFRVEVNVWRDGELFRAVATKETFEQAIDEVRSDLERALGKAREKRIGLVRKGRRMIKNMLQFGS